MSLSFPASHVLLAALVTAATTVAAGAMAQTIVVDPASAAVYDVLADAYDGPAPTRVDASGELRLAEGTAHWSDTDVVTVVPGTVLRATGDGDDARAFLAFAASPAAQRALIAAGLLPASVEVVDPAGRSHRVPQPVERIASPYSLATYLAYVLGAGDRLVTAGFLGARDPQGAAAMTRIDPRFPELSETAPSETTSVEFLATLDPDLVFASARSEWIASVEALNVPVFAFEGESPRALRDAILAVGRALGPDALARAETWTAYYDDVLARVAAAVEDRDAAPTVLFTGTDRGKAASGAMYQSAVIEAAGGTSVTASLSGHWNEVGVEQVLVWDPDWILVPPYGGASVEAIVDDPAWRLLDAVDEGRVVRMPKLVAPWDTPVPDSLLAVVWLAERLHPDAAGLSCVNEATFFYRRFYDLALAPEESAALCGP